MTPDFSDIFDESAARAQDAQAKLSAAEAVESQRRRANAEKLHAHMGAVVEPILKVACEQLSEHGKNARLEAVRVCSIAPELSMGAQVVHRDLDGHQTAIARLIYQGECDTMEIHCDACGTGRFANIGSKDVLTVSLCTAQSVEAKVRAFIRAILGLE